MARLVVQGWKPDWLNKALVTIGLTRGQHAKLGNYAAAGCKIKFTFRIKVRCNMGMATSMNIGGST